MRKITSLLMLFCLFVGTAWAQINSETAYRIKDNSRSKYLTIRSYNGTSNGQYGTVPVVDKAVGNIDQVWFFEDDGNGNYYLKSKSGYYLVCRGWCVDALNDGTKSAITLEASEDVYYLKNGSKYFKVEDISADGGTAHPFCDAPSGHANIVTWTLEEVDESEFSNTVLVTYVYKIGDKVLTTSNPVVQEKNSAASAPSVKFVNIDGYTGTIGEEDCEIIVNCSENLPFEVTTDLNNPVWQLVEMHRYSTFRVWEYSENDAAVKVVNYATNKSAVIEDNKFWCFTGNLVDGFKIYNKAATTAYTLNATDGNVSVGTATDGNDLWKLAASTATSAPAACFTNNGTSFMNQNNGVIKYHNEADNGSTCYFYDYEDLADFVLTEADEIKNVPTGVVGAYIISEETQTELDNAYSALVADKANIEASKNLVSIINSINEGDKIELTAGYYFIKATGNGNTANWYLTHKINNEKECVWAQAPTAKLTADYIWKFETCEDGFKIQSANVGKYFQMKTATNGGDNNTYIENDYNAGNKFLFTLSGAGKFIIKNANNQNIRTENDGQVNYWDGEAGETWYLFPATELEIDLNEVNGKFYSTGYYPFAVSTDANTTAFVAATGEGVLNMSAVEGAVPAETGVVFESTEAVATLTIGDEATPVASALSGTLTETAANGSLVLNAVDGVLGFYALNAEKTIGANKAFYTAPAAAVALNFGGNTTAIETVVNGLDLNAPIYDLSGRRVNNATKGIYIQNGKKFIVK